MRPNIFLTTLILAALTCAGSVRAESIANPHYASWSKCKAGTTTSHVSHVEGDPPSKITTVTTRLLAVTPDKCTLESTITNDGKSHQIKSDEQREITDPESIEQYKKETAHLTDDSVTTPAGTFKCKLANYELEDVGRMKVWFSDAVPGGTVKQVMISSGKTRTYELVSLTRK